MTCKIVDIALPADNRIRLEKCGKKDKYLDIKKKQQSMEHEGDNYANRDWCFRYSNKGLLSPGELS